MELKFQLPNPDDYQSRVEQFFTQMRISLKAAEKSYQEAIKDYAVEDKGNVYISFTHADNECKEVIETLRESGTIDRQDQELFIEVASV